jgi:3-hydroxyisobutyrate dehydrogenase
MGGPMSRRLLEAGHRLVVYNRTSSKAVPLAAAGATVAASLSELVARSTVICACLDRLEASEEVWLGPGGVRSGASAGSIAIDHGTIGPALARRIGIGLGERGIEFLDAPVSGGPEGAGQGTLTIMAGGSAEAFETALPVLRAYGRTIVRMGPIGAGSLTKLVNQLLTFVHGAAAAEAIGLAERLGLDLRSLGDVLQASFGQSRMLARTLGRVLERDFEAGAPLRLYGKDLRLVHELGHSANAALPMIGAASRVLEQAQAAGLSDQDIAALVTLFRDRDNGSVGIRHR